MQHFVKMKYDEIAMPHNYLRFLFLLFFFWQVPGVPAGRRFFLVLICKEGRLGGGGIGVGADAGEGELNMVRIRF
jgi:hypothetical protein